MGDGDRAGATAMSATRTERSTRTPSSRCPMPRIYVEEHRRRVLRGRCTTAAGSYRANAAAYDKPASTALDRRDPCGGGARSRAEKRVVITSHDAFGYFAHEYGITFLAPEGVSTEAEASAADVAAADPAGARQDQAAALFVENVTNPRPDRADRGARPG